MLGSIPFVMPVSAPFMPDGAAAVALHCAARRGTAAVRRRRALLRRQGGGRTRVAAAVPVPCALAKPVPAINAAVATEIKKRLVIRKSPHVFLHCPHRQREEYARCSGTLAVPPTLFVNG